MLELNFISFSDLKFKPHTVIPGGVQARVEFPDGSSASIIGGKMGVYGDGDTTFEVWFSDEEDPRGWQTIEELEKEFYKRCMPFMKLIR